MTSNCCLISSERKSKDSGTQESADKFGWAVENKFAGRPNNNSNGEVPVAECTRVRYARAERRPLPRLICLYERGSPNQTDSGLISTQKPIAFYSRKLTPAEKNYSVTELELLAIVFLVLVSKSRHWLVGRTTTVVTDHEALQYLLAASELKSRLVRYRLVVYR